MPAYQLLTHISNTHFFSSHQRVLVPNQFCTSSDKICAYLLRFIILGCYTNSEERLEPIGQRKMKCFMNIQLLLYINHWSNFPYCAPVTVHKKNSIMLRNSSRMLWERGIQNGIARRAGFFAEFVTTEISTQAAMAASVGTSVLVDGAFDTSSSPATTGGEDDDMEVKWMDGVFECHDAFECLVLNRCHEHPWLSNMVGIEHSWEYDVRYLHWRDWQMRRQGQNDAMEVGQQGLYVGGNLGMVRSVGWTGDEWVRTLDYYLEVPWGS